MRFTISVLVALLYRTALAQVHVPLFNEPTRIWTVELSGTFDAQCLDRYTTTYWLAGDTVIDGLTYARVANRTAYRQGTILAMNCNASYDYDGPVHLVREADRRVFFRSEDGEHLIYDFTAGVGDTIPFPSNQTPTLMAPDETWITVIAIDSVEVDGQYRKRFIADSLDQLGPQPMVIEGIGGGNGPFQPLYGHLGLSHDVRLRCVAEEGDVIYGEDPCWFVTGIPASTTRASVRVVPNPSAGMFDILGARPGVHYHVLDPSGTVVRSGSDQRVDLGEHPPGLYLLRLWSRDGTPLRTHRLIVAR